MYCGCWGPVLDRDGVGIHKRFRLQDSANRATLIDTRTGAMLKVQGSDPRRLHGAAPRLLIGDELAQWPPAQIDAMLAALETSRGKIEDSRALWIGTRPAGAEHPFERYLQGGVGYAQIHAAGPGDPPFQRRTWKKANPGLDHLPDLEAAIRREAAAAKRDPARLAAFKALRLNLGISDVERQHLLPVEVWRGIEGKADRDGPCFWGVDLGTSAAQSAVASYWPGTGRLECLAAFPSLPSLADRGQTDGIGPLYSECARRGELLTLGENAADVGALLGVALDRFGQPKRIASDRWREAELKDAIKGVGIGSGRLDLRGMGFKDGAEDVRMFTRACLEGRVTPVPSLLLASAMAEARTVIDPAGNAKLAKGTEGGRRLRARDDAAAAGILAVGAGRTATEAHRRLDFRVDRMKRHLALNRKLWRRVRLQVMDRDGWRCQTCGHVGRECDHIIALFKGGPEYDLSNLQCLCKKCHIAKTRLENRTVLHESQDAWDAFVKELLLGVV